MSLNGLNKHRFGFNFIRDQSCIYRLDSYGDEIYFLFDCSSYQNPRIRLFDEIKGNFKVL